jgi:hypothetical protein
VKLPAAFSASASGPERLERGGPWPLPTVEAEVNGDSKRTNERGPSLVGSLACRAGTRDFCSLS